MKNSTNNRQSTISNCLSFLSIVDLKITIRRYFTYGQKITMSILSKLYKKIKQYVRLLIGKTKRKIHRSQQSTISNHQFSFINRQSTIVVLVAIPVAVIWGLLLYRWIVAPRPANLGETTKDNNYYFQGSSNLYTVKIGDKKNNEPKVEFTLDKNKSVTFSPASARTGLVAPIEKNNTVTFKNVYPDTDYVYKTIPLGIKEDIIVNKPNGISTYPFFIETKGVSPRYYTTDIAGGVFYDENNNYLFNFEKPFAIDAKNNRTDKVGITIRKDEQTGKLVAILTVDKDWINSPDRVYPITIDPTIVHDTTAEFATGQLNRAIDTGSGSSPNLITNYQELPSDINTIGLWHMNEGTANTCSGGVNDICDASGNANHGAFNNHTAFSTTNILGGYSTTYDGIDDYTSWATGFGSPNTMTIEFWFKTTTTSLSALFGQMSGLPTGAPASYVPTILINTTGTIRAEYWTGATAAITSSGAYNDGNWHHLGFTTNGSSQDLYLDGVYIGSRLGTTNNSWWTNTTLGAGYIDTGRGAASNAWKYFNGYIDEFKITNTFKGPEEIKLDAQRRPYSVYTSEVIDMTNVAAWNSLSWNGAGFATGDGETATPSAASSLVAQWNFNETSGTTADNAQGTAALDGTLTNFDSTASQDANTTSCWTANNRRWGAGGLMFDGSNDYVTVTNQASLNPTSAISVESWINLKSLPTSGNLYEIAGKSSSVAGHAEYDLAIYNNSGVVIQTYWRMHLSSSLTTYTYQSNYPFVPGIWYHIVATYDSATAKMSIYVNGQKIGADMTTLGESIYSGNGQNLFIGVFDYNGTKSRYLSGTLDSTRIYSRALTASEILSNYQAGNVELQTRVGASADANDGTWEAWRPTTSESVVDTMDSNPNINSFSKLLMHNTGIDTSTTFIDSELLPKTITANGNAQLDTAQSKFGAASGLFDGDGDYLTLLDSDDWYFGTDDFTIDGWFRFSDVTSDDVIASQYVDANNNWYIRKYSNNKLYMRFRSGGVDQGYYVMTNTSTMVNNTWYHLAFVRSGSTGYMFIDGVSQTLTELTAFGTNSLPNIAAVLQISRLGSTNTYDYYGWIDELRISKGFAHWTSNFTPPLGQYDDIFFPSTLTDTTTKIEGVASEKIITGSPRIDVNTVGLWHLDETGGTGAYIKDSTTNANHGTPTGTTLTNGFSGKARSFNGSSDKISIPSSANYNFSADFSIDFWFKTSSSSLMYPLSFGASPNNLNFDFNDSGYGLWLYWNGTGTPNIWTTTTYYDNKWHHVVATRIGSTITLYVDGVSIGTSTYATAINAGTNNDRFFGCYQGSANFWNGSLDELRIKNGAGMTAEEVAEAYRAGRDHYINKTISSTDLSSSNKLPFYVASDRQGTFLNAVIGESAFANYQPDGNTVGLWHLDEQSGSGAYIKDSSGNANNGTPTGTTYTQGKIGKGRSINGGTDKIIASNTNFIHRTNNFTYDWWVNWNATPSTNQTYFENGSWVNTLLIRQESSTALNIYSMSTNYGAFTFAPVAGKWYHLAVVRNGNTIYLYVNGVLSGSLAFNVDVQPAANLYLGSSQHTTGQVINAIMDEVRISNTARTADEIRQAYEVGARTHNITIDFKAALNSGNLITNTSDLSFNIDSTAYGASAMGSNLYLGDKIIVKENYDGTEYVAQGTVNAVTASSGAVTVTAWDSGSTVPSGGFTTGATVFKWQREYFDITGSLSTHRNATTNLTLRVTDGSQGSNIWLDDFRSSTGYLNNPFGSTITSSLLNRYFQYRVVNTSSDTAVSPSFTSLTLDYTSNTAPNLPTLDSPTNTATSQPLLAVLKTTATDNDSDTIKYKIVVCTDSGMSTGCKTFDQTSTTTGWSAASYASGVQGIYTIQAADILSAGTVYYWKSYAIDPSGTNTWSATQVAPYSFTTDYAPTAPTLLLTQGASNPTGVITQTPYFSAIYNDPDSNNAVFYQIQVNTASNFAGTSMWDSGKTAMTSTANGARSPDITYAGSTLSWGGTYYWRIKFWDTPDLEGAYPSASQFTLSVLPASATNCQIVENPDKVSLTVTWTDNATNEDNYEVQKSIDGGAFSILHTSLAANTVSDIDTNIPFGHTYQYRVAPYSSDGPMYASWCTTTILNFELSEFIFKGVNLKGINLY